MTCISCRAGIASGTATPYGPICLSCARAAELPEVQGSLLIEDNGPLFAATTEG